MFHWIPGLKNFLCCFDLRTGAFVIGILESFLYMADFITTFTVIKEEDVELTTFEFILLYLERVFHLIGVFVAVCLVCGAYGVSKEILLCDLCVPQKFQIIQFFLYSHTCVIQENVKLVAINVYGVFFITIITFLIAVDLLMGQFMKYLTIFTVLFGKKFHFIVLIDK